MTDETGFLRAILDEPSNDVLRLVYADWLEEQEDPVAREKAEALRLIVQGTEVPVEEPKGDVPSSRVQRIAQVVRNAVSRLGSVKGRRTANVQQQRLRELACRLDAEWLAVTSRLPVENCPTKRAAKRGRNEDRSPFQFVCDRRWEDLQVTEDRTVRFCEGCQQRVQYCGTITEMERCAEYGVCVAVDLGIIRSEGDLEPKRIVMGELISDYFPRQEER